MSLKRTQKEKLDQVMVLASRLVEAGVSRETGTFKEFSDLCNQFLRDNKNYDAILTSYPGYKITIELSTSRNKDCSARIHKLRV